MSTANFSKTQMVPQQPTAAIRERDAPSSDLEISRREFAEGKRIPHEQVKRESLELLNHLAANRKRDTV